MSLTAQELAREAANTGFQAEILEKVFRLIGLLNGLRSHPYLRQRIALKGGTALNLFIFNVPRLSVDIDLNYVGANDRETMLAERPKVEQAIEAVCSREGFTIRRIPTEHAGGKWQLKYTGATGQGGNLELDLNFILRVPLWPTQLRDSHLVSSFQATQVPLLDIHELAAGKLAALCDRGASRDLFDAYALLRRDDLDHDRLRLGFVVYGGASRRDWRTVTIENIECDAVELRGKLLPTLRNVETDAFRDAKAWAEQRVSEVRSLMSAVLPLRPNEIKFLDHLNDRGKIIPELLAQEEKMQALIRQHPALNWKAMNVRKHYRLD